MKSIGVDEGDFVYVLGFPMALVSAYLPYQGIAISQQPRRPRIIFEEHSGLSVVYPIDYINEIIAARLADRPENEA
ncbi:MAG: hypothetical protein IT332_03070 [Ardenticatenales bacterium]|nr:hypothetical protein [Ardenticatenales bacterium]